MFLFKKTDWQNLPQGVVALIIIQIFASLSFSVLYSTLFLYLTNQLHVSMTMANGTIGVFVAFNFALHLLGGYWGGRILSFRSLFCLGMIWQIVGCLMLSTLQLANLYMGMAVFLTGTGLTVTCINCMITQRFAPHDNRRETVFLYSYTAINIGFLMGFILSGYFQLLKDYQHLFIICCIGNLLALVICCYNWRALDDKDTIFKSYPDKKQQQLSCLSILLLFLLPIVLSYLFQFAWFANKLVLVCGVCLLMAICRLALSFDTSTRNKLLAFVLLIIIGVVFATLFHIGPMGLTVFITNNVNRHFAEFIIPPQWFHTINTLAVIIGGPLLSFLLNYLRRNNIDVNVPAQFTYALLFIGFAYLALPLGIKCADSAGLISPYWVLVTYLSQSIGELLITPIGYAMIGSLVPTHLQGIMMGAWMFSIGVGACLSSYCSNLMIVGTNLNPLITNPGFSHVFLRLGLLAIAAGFILKALAPILKKWVSNDNDSHTSKLEIRSKIEV